MTWRYAFARERGNHPAEAVVWTIREVYHSEDGAISWTAEPVAPQGSSLGELYDDLTKMVNGVGAKILDLTLDPPELVSPLDLLPVDPPASG